MIGLKFLKSRKEYEDSTVEMVKRGLVPHYQPVKNWDLMNILPHLRDGNMLDMGSTDSYILHNAVQMGLKGEKYGIDLRAPLVPASGVRYVVGDITEKTQFPEGNFDFITCLSVVEHGVDVAKWAVECSRLSKKGTLLFATFDYWTPKISWVTTLNGYPWNIFDDNDAKNMIAEMERNGFVVDGDQDWASPVPVIDVSNGAPPHLPGLAATFGFVRLRKT